MSMIKRIISTVASATLIGSCMISIPAEAKVITPEIVKTETWTTSYYIDDDIETLYPYVECRADIYNDGTLSVSFWNNHEWDGFATVSHTITLINTAPVPTEDDYDKVYKNRDKLNNYPNVGYGTYNYGNYGNYTSIADVSYYPNEYKYYILNRGFTTDSVYWTTYTGNTGMYIPVIYINTYLPNLYVGEEYCTTITLTPTVDPTGTYNFHILGHDITITPEILSSNIIATPVLTTEDKLRAERDDIRSQYNTLAEEYKALKAENDVLKHDNVAYQIDIIGKTEIIDTFTKAVSELKATIDELETKIHEYESIIAQQTITINNQNEELLASQNIIKEYEDKILMYEDKIAKMSSTAEIVSTMGDNIKRCDINGDSLIDAVDASIILSAYARISTGENIQHISQVVN